jgi:hypothetical protein
VKFEVGRFDAWPFPLDTSNLKLLPMPFRAHYKQVQQDELALFFADAQPVFLAITLVLHSSYRSFAPPANWLCFAYSAIGFSLTDPRELALFRTPAHACHCRRARTLSHPSIRNPQSAIAGPPAPELALFGITVHPLPASLLAELALFCTAARRQTGFVSHDRFLAPTEQALQIGFVSHARFCS